MFVSAMFLSPGKRVHSLALSLDGILRTLSHSYTVVVPALVRWQAPKWDSAFPGFFNDIMGEAPPYPNLISL